MRSFIVEKNDENKTVADFFREKELDFLPVSYSINKDMVPHNTKLKEGDLAESYSMTHKLGYRVYVNSMVFLLSYVVHEQIPKGAFEVSHTISKGLYCSFKNGMTFKESQVGLIKNRMKELIKEDIKFEIELKKRDEGIKILKNNPINTEKWKFGDKFPEEFPIYGIGEYKDYYY